jgi:hypothetical protein
MLTLHLPQELRALQTQLEHALLAKARAERSRDALASRLDPSSPIRHSLGGPSGRRPFTAGSGSLAASGYSPGGGERSSKEWRAVAAAAGGGGGGGGIGVGLVEGGRVGGPGVGTDDTQLQQDRAAAAAVAAEAR